MAITRTSGGFLGALAVGAAYEVTTREEPELQSLS